MPDAPPPPLRIAIARGVAAARANLLPAVLLWALGSAIVLGYSFIPPVRSLLERVAEAKQTYGIAYSIPSMMFFAALLPFVMQVFQRGDRRNFSRSWLAFLLIFWGLKGIEVDLLYRAQAAVFGDNNAPGTIAMKTLVDQLIYVPLWAMPTMVVPYLWARRRFDFADTRQRLRGSWYRREVLPVMISNWAVWLPAVVLIYTLPLPLQFPIQNVVVCFWGLMIMFLSAEA